MGPEGLRHSPVKSGGPPPNSFIVRRQHACGIWITNGVFVFLHLCQLERIRIGGRGANRLCAPCGVAEVVRDVVLGDVGISKARSPRRVRIYLWGPEPRRRWRSVIERDVLGPNPAF